MRSATALLLAVFLHAPIAVDAQRPAAPGPISTDSLRAALFTLAHDSMGGRQTGEIGDWKAQEWIAARFQRYGLRPAGDNGSYFQVIPFQRVYVDTSARITASGTALAVGRDILPVGAAVSWPVNGVQAVFAGWVNRPETWIDSATAAGRLIVVAFPDSARDFRGIFAALGAARQAAGFRAAKAAALVVLDRIAPDLIPQVLSGRITTDTSTAAPPGARPLWLVTPAAGRALLGGTTDAASARPGTVGGALGGEVRYLRSPLEHPARNVVAVLPGSDPALRGQYVSLSAHHDHVGYTGQAVDHDSTYAFNRVVRPAGADSPMRPATAEEAIRVTALLDSLRAAHGGRGRARPDSVFNGADDDGSGTVAILEIARTLSAGGGPRRSLLFVSHAAEERGLLGSGWYTDHPTVPRDSIVSELDLDMVGRGNVSDLPKGGHGYLEVVGLRRLSTEYGDILEQVNSRLPQPFTFNYEYDAPGHPLQYYCRADHYSYARYGIPSVALSRGEHADYHQVTDEPAYIDYGAVARVATLGRAFLLAVGNLDHRPVVDGPVQADPHAPCRQ